VQEGISSTMGAPLVLSKNRNGSPENRSTPVAEEQTQIEVVAEAEEDSTVNGKLDINIKENTTYEKSDTNNTRTNKPTDFRHNYH